MIVGLLNRERRLALGVDDLELFHLRFIGAVLAAEAQLEGGHDEPCCVDAVTLAASEACFTWEDLAPEAQELWLAANTDEWRATLRDMLLAVRADRRRAA